MEKFLVLRHMKPMIDPAFWSDADVEQCGPACKLAALWLITNSQTTVIGVCRASSARFTFETGLDAAILSETVEAMPRTFRRFSDAIFVRTYIRRQFGTGEKLVKNNFFVTLRSAFEAVRDQKLSSAILSEYPEFGESPKGFSRASQGLIKPEVSEGKVREGKDTLSGGVGERPTLEEFLKANSTLVPPMEDAEARRWWNQREADGWVDWRNFPIKSWRHAAQAKAITLAEGAKEKAMKTRVKKNGSVPPPEKPSALRVCPIEIELPDAEEQEPE